MSLTKNLKTGSFFIAHICPNIFNDFSFLQKKLPQIVVYFSFACGQDKPNIFRKKKTKFDTCCLTALHNSDKLELQVQMHVLVLTRLPTN